MPNGRCRIHGGLSTGAKTEEGKARQIAAMVAGRRAWVERMQAEGKKLPCGPKPKKKPPAAVTVTVPLTPKTTDPTADLQRLALMKLARLRQLGLY